jgi:conjugal transfer pilus assembly protein TraK
MRNHLISLLFFLLVGFISTNVFAIQVVSTDRSGKTYTVNYSRYDMTRLEIKGGRIVSLHYPADRLTVEKDDDQGYAILRARDDKPVSLLVTTSTGQTHALYMLPVDMPMDTVQIKESGEGFQKQVSPNAAVTPNDTLAIQVKRLILDMARNERRLPDYQIDDINKPVDLWAESYFVLLNEYKGARFDAYRFSLKNISSKVMKLAEQEFYKKGVVAVGIDTHVLNPGQATFIYVIMVKNDG